MANTVTLHTLGYEKRSIDEFIELLASAGIDVLVDVRETAWSHKPGFSKTGLTQALAGCGIDYVHAAFAGNPKRLRASAASHTECLEAFERHLDNAHDVLHQFEALVADLVAAGLRVCLTCFERHPADCHRGVLAERWALEPGRRVEHIAPDGCARLAPLRGT